MGSAFDCMSARPSFRQRGYDARWDRLSKRFRRSHPTCPCGQPSQVVHHLDGLGPTGPRGYDESNLQALCKQCHDRITGSEVGGFATQPKRQRPAEPHPGLT
jgi:5-methylcytosine-specific restriction protein A